ncbi:Uncharacterized conserved protein YacL, contains PIN and TRAM domains [Hathewaya proteolytica DSM 3090]|uniref:Uncharacterized conserved protein YacL, contains PIN and TRAM domains n=1 Tax=Hathewaya proteolytica DSM 3090 TaxID=1121331 RepID=A0A1M6T612_9CLOT|nr:PIN/TRAM domain-containing protein [Hathewaya proteolytica]SHK52188.1 Uncharacterized conserved protein YacL, contains PIN and TRAM domains [Hathewaya proteolytica DSM 3090]
MIKKILRVLFTLAGSAIGYIVAKEVLELSYVNRLTYIQYIVGNEIYKAIYISIIILLFSLLMFMVSPILAKWTMNGIEQVEHAIQKRPINEIIFGTLGAIIGLLISTLFLSQLNIDSIIWTVITSIITVIIMIVCVDVAIKKKEDINGFISGFKKSSGSKEKKSKGRATAKVLDTSVIIDGRILDICKTGFVEGTLVIPQFVLEELRHIADSSDDLKRVRGRRGLDVLNSIQNDLNVPVEISDTDFPDIKEVDSKLLKLAQELNGKVLTNDFNLNKVAQFQGVEVLNINELANSIKPILLPGEEMVVQLVKDGKEPGQGVAYLDDGTMIVVEGGRKYMGQNVKIEVTSALQTAAGRMIFGRVIESIQ